MKDKLAKLGPKNSTAGIGNTYTTPLNLGDRLQFEIFKSVNNIPEGRKGLSNAYDMQGFFKSMLEKGGTAFKMPDDGSTAELPDGLLHFSDMFKTPFHPTYSNQSKYKIDGINRDWVLNEDGKTWSLKDLDTGMVIRDERNAFTLPGLLRG